MTINVHVGRHLVGMNGQASKETIIVPHQCDVDEIYKKGLDKQDLLILGPMRKKFSHAKTSSQIDLNNPTKFPTMLVFK